MSANENVAGSKNNTGKKGPKGRGAAFDEEELECMLDLIDEYRPFGPGQWEIVVGKHNEHFGMHGRDEHSICCKLNALLTVKKYTLTKKTRKAKTKSV